MDTNTHRDVRYFRGASAITVHGFSQMFTVPQEIWDAYALSTSEIRIQFRWSTTGPAVAVASTSDGTINKEPTTLTFTVALPSFPDPRGSGHNAEDPRVWFDILVVSQNGVTTPLPGRFVWPFESRLTGA